MIDHCFSWFPMSCLFRLSGTLWIHSFRFLSFLLARVFFSFIFWKQALGFILSKGWFFFSFLLHTCHVVMFSITDPRQIRYDSREACWCGMIQRLIQAKKRGYRVRLVVRGWSLGMVFVLRFAPFSFSFGAWSTGLISQSLRERKWISCKRIEISSL